jgi:hypothetical protein
LEVIFLTRKINNNLPIKLLAERVYA